MADWVRGQGREQEMGNGVVIVASDARARKVLEIIREETRDVEQFENGTRQEKGRVQVLPGPLVGHPGQYSSYAIHFINLLTLRDPSVE